MKAEDVNKLYRLFEENGIKVWINGGWGIDALLGEQTRPHNDLDIAVQHKNAPKLRELLEGKGYKEIKRPDSKDYNFVLGDNNGHEVDVHTFEYDDKGNNIFGTEYPKESLTGTGIINGQRVKCIALEYVLKFHSNYEPTEKDFKDIKALCDKFRVEPPKNYNEGNK